MHSSQSEKWQSKLGALWKPRFSRKIIYKSKNGLKSAKNEIQGFFFLKTTISYEFPPFLEFSSEIISSS
jgi:hypothetical protein